MSTVFNAVAPIGDISNRGLVLKKRRKLEYLHVEHPLGAEKKTNKLNPHEMLSLGTETQATLVGSECSCHHASPAPYYLVMQVLKWADYWLMWN